MDFILFYPGKVELNYNTRRIKNRMPFATKFIGISNVPNFATL
jgi:hypothetical protein